MRLYHYCCSHSFYQIIRDGFLKPHAQVALSGKPLIWLTDMDVPDRTGLGLTSYLLDCDRLEHRLTVDADAEHWPLYARRLPLEQRRRLEMEPGALPMHWYVSEQRIPVVEIVDQTGMKSRE